MHEPLDLYKLFGIAREYDEFKILQDSLGAKDMKSAMPFMPAYRKLVGHPLPNPFKRQQLKQAKNANARNAEAQRLESHRIREYRDLRLASHFDYQERAGLTLCKQKRNARMSQCLTPATENARTETSEPTPVE